MGILGVANGKPGLSNSYRVRSKKFRPPKENDRHEGNKWIVSTLSPKLCPVNQKQSIHYFRFCGSDKLRTSKEPRHTNLVFKVDECLGETDIMVSSSNALSPIVSAPSPYIRNGNTFSNVAGDESPQ